jgi:hypothetical protein
MKQIIGGIKCQTIRYTVNNGWFCVAYPAKQKQVNSLLTKDYEWFLGTADEKIPDTMGHKRVGEIVRCVAKELHNYIVNVQGKLFPNNSMLVQPYGYPDPWYNIPWFNRAGQKHPATKDFIKQVGHIKDKKIMNRFNHIGNTKWSDGHFHKKVKQDTNKMQKKGIIAEEIMKTEYFEKQSTIKHVELSPQIYSSWDVKIDYEKEAA